MLKKIPLHIQILVALLAGAFFGIAAAYLNLQQFTKDYISPFGTIFVNVLTLIAVPLILASLIKGISSLTDIAKLSRIGTKSVSLYLISTVIAITIGLLTVNVLKPGEAFSEERRAEFNELYGVSAEERAIRAEEVRDDGPLQFLVDIVPSNIFHSFQDNTKMLQVIFFAFLFGICLVLLPHEKVRPVKEFIDGFNEVILKMVDLIMKAAPYGVFALMASLITDFAGDKPEEAIELLQVLGFYTFTAILGLSFMMFLVYPLVLLFFTKTNYLDFLKGIGPAQMLAFSTSSSAAALPVTMKRCETELGVSKEISSFVLPLGATINMDGTSLYQAVAAVFIAQAFGMDLNLTQQLTIVLTATLASIGAAAVPGAGIVMLVIVLQSIGLEADGIALILAVDRIIDMCRTSVNVTGDATIAMLVAKSENSLIENKNAKNE
ncbi:MAG: dicarboxylate/amino acid:cation symporter [Chitinophagaceae bacterium]|nr:MAG: dicarboxylate/amino acid:cation symporter [Chitinophagaceae bacterium]